jgi:hypothetical protein
MNSVVRWLVTHDMYVPEWILLRHFNHVLKTKGY